MKSWLRSMIVGGISILFSFSIVTARELNPKDQAPQIKGVRNFLATYLGGSGEEFCEAIALDEAGNIYVTGSTTSADFPVTSGAYHSPAKGKADVFIMKFDKDLKTLLASAIIGGDADECGYSIIFDKRGFVYVAGYTESKNFPTTPGAFGPQYKGGKGDAFIIKMDRHLTALAASTFLGGSGNENDWRSPEIVQDKTGNIYIAGITDSPDFPSMAGVFQPKYNGGPMDVFLSKFDADLKTLLASTFLGGNADDRLGRSLAIDKKSDEIVLGGYTFSPNFPVSPNAFSKNISGQLDGFVVKLSPDLSKLTASTILDGGWIYCLMIHENGDIYVGGHGGGKKLGTPNAYYRSFDKHGDQGFISRLSHDLTRLVASTVLPGSYPADMGEIDCLSLAQSPEGDIVAAGWAKPKDFPVTPGAFDETENGETDTFILKMNPELSKLLASTFVGGAKSERWNRMVTDGSGSVYVAGYTFSTNFPTTAGSATEKFAGGPTDGFIVKIGGSLRTDSPEAFHEAAKLNNLEAVGKFLSADGGLLEKLDQYKRTALHSAARYGALTVAGYLADKGANIGAKDEGGDTPLHLAAMFGHEDMIDLLLKRNADPNALDLEGLSPLYLASYYGTEKSLSRLLAGKADPLKADKDGNTPLHIAALSGNAEKVAVLSKPKTGIDARNGAGQTALHMAVQGENQLPIIELLLDGGADLAVADGTGNTALLLARGLDTQKPELLLKRGAKIGARDNAGNSVLHNELLELQNFRKMTGGAPIPPFIMDRTIDRIKMFMTYGADPRVKNKKEQTPLDLAREIGDKALIDLFTPVNK
jgi:ankyrin repeat protein